MLVLTCTCRTLVIFMSPRALRAVVCARYYNSYCLIYPLWLRVVERLQEDGSSAWIRCYTVGLKGCMFSGSDWCMRDLRDIYMHTAKLFGFMVKFKEKKSRTPCNMPVGNLSRNVLWRYPQCVNDMSRGLEHQLVDLSMKKTAWWGKRTQTIGSHHWRACSILLKTLSSTTKRRTTATKPGNTNVGEDRRVHFVKQIRIKFYFPLSPHTQ